MVTGIADDKIVCATRTCATQGIYIVA